jgi:hypothetical protein
MTEWLKDRKESQERKGSHRERERQGGRQWLKTTMTEERVEEGKTHKLRKKAKYL